MNNLIISNNDYKTNYSSTQSIVIIAIFIGKHTIMTVAITPIPLIIIASIIIIITLLLWRYIYKLNNRTANIAIQLREFSQTLLATLNDQQRQQQTADHLLKENLAEKFALHRQRFDEHQLQSLQTLQTSILQGMTTAQQQLLETLKHQSTTIDQRLKEISGQVEKRLTEGFEKTTATFTNILTRLALIDEAQKKITELSTNIVSLQDILTDKKSRGVFGETQLSTLIRNVLPEKNFAFQYTLSNNKRVDCMLFLPKPTGHVAIDAKFPLETYRRLLDVSHDDPQHAAIAQQFRHDIKHHIQDIASKYIIANETADGAVMFIPAEAIFAEIHANFPELVEAAHKARVWMVSPTTMMAILTTARAVLKDAATRQQIHIIQEHLAHLAADFNRFQKRMDNLARHIHQAHDDIEDVHVSAKKISSRFGKIEKVEFEAISSAD